MTIGEYAQMLVGEKWINHASDLKLNVITCANYDHTSLYQLPVPPSPNLRDMNAIYLYPSLCFFEGTVISVGRGTNKPFEQWGHPDLVGKFKHTFIPKSRQGAHQPLYEGQVCFGEKLQSNLVNKTQANDGKLNLSYLLKAYNAYPEKAKFFNSFFEKLAGTKQLRQQIIAGKSEETIRKSWQNDLESFKKIRKKYLLYKDYY
jgi:uncharacterized protein YbbC (DUF1343 family)